MHSFTFRMLCALTLIFGFASCKKESGTSKNGGPVFDAQNQQKNNLTCRS